MQAQGFSPNVLDSGSRVKVYEADGSIIFEPTSDVEPVGLIFYPGALVDPDAYAPLARHVAETGYKVALVTVPFRIDLFEWQWQEVKRRTEAVISGGTDISAWVIGGHSRGGKMATRFAKEHPELLQGLLLVGTSHPRVLDLSHLRLDVTKVYGSADGLASEEEVKTFATRLPDDTHFVRIDGGNHRQFGYYGWQLGDGDAAISRETQTRKTVEAILEQLTRVEQIEVMQLGRTP